MRRPPPKRVNKAPAGLTADQVAEGLWAWLGSRRWFLADDVMHGDVTQEHAAQEAVLMLARGDDDAFRALPVGVRALALRFILDFLARLIGPLSKVTWPVTLEGEGPAALQAAAWRAIELEVARSLPPPTPPH